MLSPRELEKTTLLNVGAIAQKRLAQGMRLNIPEATALLATQVIHFARVGYTVAKLMELGRNILGLRQVIPGVANILHEVQVEATFPDGTKLVTLHYPVCRENGNLELALAGSFLPVPPFESFPTHPEEGLIPGEILHINDNPIHINSGREMLDDLVVLNTADRPIQVGSHYHFIETNPLLRFNRLKSYGMRLNIPAGTSTRFEPGEMKTVSLVRIGGNKIITGGNGIATGLFDRSDVKMQNIARKIHSEGFLNFSDADEESVAGNGGTVPTSSKKRKFEENNDTSVPPYEGLPIDRSLYSRMYGPTTGDVVRLADTCLFVRVEKDLTVYGDECKFGGGKVLREGMGQATDYTASEVLDTVITNALIIDYTGIYKADVGIKNGCIAGIGKAGNPDVMDNVTPGMVVGVNTEAIAGEGLILTAGGMDSHVHFICPQICDEAIASGLTTLLGGGTGPASGTCATTCTPGPWHMEMMLKATDEIPMNFGFTGKGNCSSMRGLLDIIEAGAVGLKLHEDWGTTPAAIDCCLSIADQEDVQVTIHTDTLNESGCVEKTIESIHGRTIHTYHTEGAGGGHAPDIISIASHPNVIPSSTNPTRPLTINTIDEHLDMLMVCHHLDKSIKEDVAFAESRIRQETVAAEDILHDMGAISIISSDSQAMGRIGEVITRTWQTADKMKRQRGQLDEDRLQDDMIAVSSIKTDNFRVRRYIAKYTINPCVAHGMGHLLGSIETGKYADLVLWNPSFFAAKPEMVLKGGHIAWSQMGDANASIPTPQPVLMRPMFASKGKAASSCSIAFVSRRCLESNVVKKYGLSKKIECIKNTRNIGKKDMILNDATPSIKVDPESYEVSINGNEILKCDPVSILPLSQRYFLH